MTKELFMKRLVSAIKYLVLIVIVVVLLFPIYWMAVCSLMPTHYLTVLPPHFIPVDVTLENFARILTTAKYLRYFINSFITSFGTVALTLFIAIPAGFAFSRYRFWGKNTLLTTILSVQMFPIVVILISLYVFYLKLDMLSTYHGLIFADTTFALPLAITLTKAFFDTVPRALDESAKIDGAGRLRIMFSILFPLILPGIVAVCIYTFLNAWDDYLMALIIMQDQEMKTLTIGIAETFLGEYAYNYGGMMAFAVVGSAPIVIMFIFLQKYMITGLTAGAVKG
jgi:multiple sugar transport system permease protein